MSTCSRWAGSADRCCHAGGTTALLNGRRPPPTAARGRHRTTAVVLNMAEAVDGQDSTTATNDTWPADLGGVALIERFDGRFPTMSTRSVSATCSSPPTRPSRSMGVRASGCPERMGPKRYRSGICGPQRPTRRHDRRMPARRPGLHRDMNASHATPQPSDGLIDGTRRPCSTGSGVGTVAPPPSSNCTN